MDQDPRHMHPDLGGCGDEEQKDAQAISAVINKVKSQGLFDQFRKECLADVDTKPAYHNLIQRVEQFVERFLHGQRWSSNVNKNQLREKLRRQLNNSGMMTNGVDRIIEQVVNPKILLGIKPKIDEAVCEHMGINLKARQEEIQRRKQEQQRYLAHQQQLHQQHLQQMQNKDDDNSDVPSGMSTPGSWPPSGFPNAQTPNSSSDGQGPPVPPFQITLGGMMPQFNPMMGGWSQGLPGMEGFNQTMNPMIPGHPMIPGGLGGMPGMPPFSVAESPSSTQQENNATFSSPPPAHSQTSSTPVIPDLSKPPPISNVQTSPAVPPGIMSSAVGGHGGIRPPPPGSVPPPPGTVPISPIVNSQAASSVEPSPIPALITHSLSTLGTDDLTPEKIAVFKTAAAFITKTVNKAQGSGADLNTMFSPRVLAQAMLEESGPTLTKQDIRAQKRKERMKNFERLKQEEREKEERNIHESMRGPEMDDKEDPLPPKSNLMDVFQGAEDVSDDEEALDLLMDIEEKEDRNKQGIVFSDDSDDDEEKPPTAQPGKSQSFNHMEFVL